MYYIALENIRSLFNIGAIFRTCSFFGIKNVVLVGYSGIDLNGKLHPKVKKSSLGAEDDLNITYLKDSDELIEFVNENNLKLISIEQAPNSIEINKWHPEKNSVLVFGNEVDGISERILENSNQIVEIRRLGKHNSLNVATTLGMILNYLES